MCCATSKLLSVRGLRFNSAMMSYAFNLHMSPMFGYIYRVVDWNKNAEMGTEDTTAQKSDVRVVDRNTISDAPYRILCRCRTETPDVATREKYFTKLLPGVNHDFRF